jgi:hypothetical protein
MAKPPTSESPTEIDDESLEESFYEIPPELDEPAPARARPPTRPDDPDEPLEAARVAPRFPFEKVAIGVAAVLLLGLGLAWFRADSRAKAVRQGIAQAEASMLLDTAEGYRKAADLLEPLAKLDPVEAGSARAFALAMLSADYHDRRAEVTARELLVVPSRADSVPRYASLAFGALALGRNALGDAQVELRKAAELEQETAAGGAPVAPWSQALQARVSLRAGTLESAVEYATGAAAAPGFAAGLAVHGDAVRRARRDDRTARASYEAALAASPTHPRAAYGLAKLALAGQAPEAEARDALGRVLGSGGSTPLPERGRAALHLAALRLRDGDAVEVARRDIGLDLDEKTLDWLMGAARAEAGNRGAYRAVLGPPAVLESASDDDPKELHARAPEPPPPPPPPPQIAPPPPAPKAAVHAKPRPQAKATTKKVSAKSTVTRAKTGTTRSKATAAKSSGKRAPAKTAAKKPAPKKRR